ncbi:unnamed protein product [Sphagnum balticum]
MLAEEPGTRIRNLRPAHVGGTLESAYVLRAHLSEVSKILLSAHPAQHSKLDVYICSEESWTSHIHRLDSKVERLQNALCKAGC